jgi:MFS family permease
VAPLTVIARDRAMRLSLFEGAFTALMVGAGECYFIAEAVRLRATPVEIGILVTLPLSLGALGPLATLAALHRLGRRKSWTVAAAFAQSAGLLAISLLDLSGLLNVWVLILCASFHQVAGMAAGTAWSSWYGDLVPAELRGRYFSQRNRGVYLATFIGLISAGLVLQYLEPAAAVETGADRGGLGFQIIFAVAALARLVSGVLLALSPEPTFHGLSRPRRVFRFLGTGRGQTAWRLLFTGSAMYVATYLAAPYFGAFMLQELRFSYTEYMVATLCAVGAKFLMLPSWGKAIDHSGARPVFLLAVVLVALVPVPWLWAGSLWWVAPAQVLSGISWSGYEVSYFAVLLQASFKRTRVHVFAAQNVLNGAGQLIGGLLGGILVSRLPAGYVWIFGVSALLRLLVALAVPMVLPGGRAEHPGRRDIALRVIGFRPHGGLVHRPMLEGDDVEGTG